MTDAEKIAALEVEVQALRMGATALRVTADAVLKNADAMRSAGAITSDNIPAAVLDDACMWFRHDFGILSEDERDWVRSEARLWLAAWEKAKLHAAQETPDDRA